MTEILRYTRSLTALYVSLFTCYNVMATDPLLVSQPIGTLIQIEGEVTVLSPGQQSPIPASPKMSLHPGDIVNTGPHSWAALLLADESLIHLSRNSTLMLKQVDPRAEWFAHRPIDTKSPPAVSSYSLKKGHLWFRNKNRHQKIDIETPYVSTSIRGTELDIEINPSQTVTISVLEGVVTANRSQESVTIHALEQLRVIPGQAFDKQILLAPQDAVQWTVSLQPMIEMVFANLPDGIEPNLHQGWQHLLQGSPTEALTSFQNDNSTSPSSLLGLSITHTLLRNTQDAKTVLRQLTNTWPDYSYAWIWDSLLSLIDNQRDQSQASIQRAIQLSDHEPLAFLVQAWILQASFDLSGAMESTRKALTLDVNNTGALLNLAKLQCASGQFEHALESVERVLGQRSLHAQALSLKGYILFAMRQTQQAIDMFNQAIAQNPYLGEAHLGLALSYMRQGQQDQAFEQITTAVLLEPQKSLVLSYWAKMLYEVKRFQQALDMLEHAKRLDPYDPTPYLYQSYILTDLHRPHESIKALQKAIELNDHKAVYRSRFLLDQDLAVKNINLALIFKDLGVSEWGSQTAIKSIKLDNNNAAAQNFLAGQLEYLQGKSSFSARSARLKAFMMQPANVNTLNNFEYYTPFFEQPGFNGALKGYTGNMGYWDVTAQLHGALPQYNTAFQVEAQRYESNGWQRYDWQNYKKLNASLKWDLSFRDTLSLQTTMKDLETGDLSQQTQTNGTPDPANQSTTELADVSLGYVRHLSSDLDFYFHIKRQHQYDQYAASHLTGSGTLAPYDYLYDYTKHQWLDDPYTAVQAMQFIRINDHQFNIGTLVYKSERDYRIREVTNTDYYWNGTWVGNTFTDTQNQTLHAKQHQSYYVQDVWNPHEQITIDASLYIDHIENVNSEDDLVWSDTLVNHRLGVILRPTHQDTIRLSYLKHLDPFNTVERIDAIDVAGHLVPSFFEGAVIEEKAIGYEHEWATGLVILGGFINEPQYRYKETDSGQEVDKVLDYEYRGFETAFNQLIFQDMGLSAGYTYFDIQKDSLTSANEGLNQWAWARITKVHPSGLSASIGTSYYHTDYDTATVADSDFWNVATYIKYELPQKQGSIRFEVNNLFNERFNGTPLSDIAGLIPARFYALMVELYF